MLAKLEMSIGVCIDALKSVSRTVFKDGWTWAGRLSGGVLAQRYSGDAMREAILAIPGTNQLLRPHAGACHW